MKPFTKSLKTIGIAAAFAGASMVASLPAAAQSLSDILNRVQQDSQEMSSESQQRLRDFQTRVNEQEALMSQARNELAVANSRGNALSAQFDAYQAEINDLDAQLQEQAVTLDNWSVNSVPLLVKFSRLCARASQASTILAVLKPFLKLLKLLRFQPAKSLIVYQKRSFVR